MSTSLIFAISTGIGLVAGLRALTAPAVVSWAAYLGWLSLRGTPVSFMGSEAAVAIFTLAALGEYVSELNSKTPSHTAPGPILARIGMGGLSGVCLCAFSGGQSLIVGGLLGAAGGVIGAFGGYQARTRLVSLLKVKDAFVAIPEDLVAILLALLLVTLRRGL